MVCHVEGSAESSVGVQVSHARVERARKPANQQTTTTAQNHRTLQPTNERTNEPTNERTNQPTNERANQPTNNNQWCKDLFGAAKETSAGSLC